MLCPCVCACVSVWSGAASSTLAEGCCADWQANGSVDGERKRLMLGRGVYLEQPDGWPRDRDAAAIVLLPQAVLPALAMYIRWHEDL
jgi:hypothetical protein